MSSEKNKYLRAQKLMAAGKPVDAKALLADLIDQHPENPTYWMNFASCCAGTGDFPNAERACRQLTQFAPHAPEPYVHLASALLHQDKLTEASNTLSAALRRNPTDLQAIFSLGKTYHNKAAFDDAITCYQWVANKRPDIAEAYDSIGSIHKSRGDIETALQFYRKSINARQGFDHGFSDLVFAYNYTDNYPAEFVFSEHRAWANAITPQGRKFTHGKRCLDEKLRIGYISPDFYQHSVSYFFEPILENQDPERVENHCFADTRKYDQVSERLKQLAHGWHEITDLPHPEVARMIHGLEIDVLVDLTGHTAGSRLPVFQLKPAPIQVTYLGYPNTTGIPEIDFRFTDSDADPVNATDRYHTESLIRLEGGFLCYRPAPDSPPVSASPCMKKGYITFGSFNNLAKTTPDVVSAWAEILRQVADSRLVLKNKSLSDSKTRERFYELFARQGIDGSRLEFRPPVLSNSGHLESYNDIDIGLDTFPYNGTTTTCEALWMGVPVICLCGDRHVARVGHSLLKRVDLEMLSATDTQDYIQTAVRLALSRTKLDDIRHSLRDNMSKSDLCDGKRIARVIEDAYHSMAQQFSRRQESGK